jgi:excisionase family DNA binding protein
MNDLSKGNVCMDRLRQSADAVFIPEADTQVIQRLDAMLETAHPKLVGLDGEEIPLPDSVYRVLRQVTHMMAAGQVISLVPHDHYLSSQEAADLLNVSRPYLYSLLDQGKLPFMKVGTHRRIRFEDVMAYKQQRDSDRAQALSELAALSQEAGFYTESAIAEDCKL